MSEAILVVVFLWTLVEGDSVESLLLLVRWAYVYRHQLAAWIDDLAPLLNAKGQ